MGPGNMVVVVSSTSSSTRQATAAGSSTPSASARSSRGGGMSTGAICGTVIGSVVGALLIGVGIWIAVRGRRRGGRVREKGRRVDGTAGYEEEGETYEIGARGYRSVPSRRVDGTAGYEEEGETYETGARGYRAVASRTQHASSPSQSGSPARTGLESFEVTPLSWPPSGPVVDNAGRDGAGRGRRERHGRTSSDTAPLLPRMEVTGDGRISLNIDPDALLSGTTDCSSSSSTCVIADPFQSVDSLAQSKSLPPEPHSDVARLLKSRAEVLPPLAPSKAGTFDTLRSSTVDSTSRSLTVDTLQLGDPARWHVNFGDEPAKPVEDSDGEEEDDEDEPDSPGSIYSQASYQDSDLPPTDPLCRSSSGKSNLERGSGRRANKSSRRGPRTALRMDTVPELPDTSSLAPSPSLPNPFPAQPTPSTPSRPPSVPSKPPSAPIPITAGPLPPYPLLSTGSAAFLPPSPTLTRASSLSSAASVSAWGARYPSIAASTVGGSSTARSRASVSGYGTGSGSGKSGYASSAYVESSGSTSGSTASSRQDHLANPAPAPTSASHLTATTAENAKRAHPQSEGGSSHRWRNPPAGLDALTKSNFMASSDQLHPRSQSDPLPSLHLPPPARPDPPQSPPPPPERASCRSQHGPRGGGRAGARG
ncbi:hypothetical protein SERLA73DRAFT_151293 [Serpula lacrymans var. lacrymans S7.3]|uniref:Uncharacterized protein n=1 Tax=Serpula lacrymans var. lacrymans (strain S7.3) TaxID=936435 RepID=F8PRB8_SERL3|nr:hypothetical protein SERLA73DRAFT_151293 [Serpula lacrymans var. lacrymans S7.3]